MDDREHTQGEKPVDSEKSEEIGKPSFGKFWMQSIGFVSLLSVGLYFVQFRNDERLSPLQLGGLLVVMTLVFGTVMAAIRWLISSYQFRLAKKLGRMPEQSDVFGKLGSIKFNDRYLFIGAAVIILACVIFLVLSMGVFGNWRR